MIKERPILFSSEMVRAILAGQKTQTRRVIKNTQGYTFKGMDGHIARFGHADSILYVARHCPYGVSGDRLWVKESIRRKNLGWLMGATYLADLTPVMEDGELGCRRVKLVDWKWKRDVLSARFMPRWASRITLEIVDVRVERVQDISEDDAMAEGVEPAMMDTGAYHPSGWPVEDVPYYYPSFADLWDRINARRGYGWDTNPWVWVIEFKRVNQGATE